jgi:hypothetical protein
MSAPDCPEDFKRDAAARQPISAISICQETLRKPVLLGIERDPTVYSTLVEFGIIEAEFAH